MTEPAGTGVAAPRAFLRVGGITLARHQLGLALTMDCQRIICLAREVTPDLIALQHEAEKAGARFHVAQGPRALAGLVTANDDLLALTEGLLVDQQQAIALLEPGHAVLVQPVEAGVIAGFERIDLNHATAGAFRIPGRLVDRLLELPPDCDALSALTRIALQAGVSMQEVPAAAREGPRWRLIRDETEAHEAEAGWLRLHMGERGSQTPVILLSRFGLTSLGPSLLHGGGASRVAVLATLAAMLLGLGAGWFGLPVIGFLFCAFAAVLRESAAVLRRIERNSLGLPALSVSFEDIVGGLLDAVLVFIVMWNVESPAAEGILSRAFAPLMLIFLARLVPRMFDRAWRPWIEDRFLLALLLAIAAMTGFLLGAAQLFAVLIAAAGLIFPGGKSRLT